MDLMLAAYNAGEEAVDAYGKGRSIKAGSKIINPSGRLTGGIPPYQETINYVKVGLSIHGLIAGNSTSVSSSRIANGENNQKIPSQSIKPDLKSVLYISETQTQPQTKPSNRRSIFYSGTVELP
jgi:hypothetical protein